ncbi:uncharacterized protein LOC122558552 isoform X2 [Chiloscyllium plagiosum]|uniref:uncharacterized protein LOC122558552 isoform X2 n=1 Tax=Chiloscyllium plagiosum TaxID=36176 RepID=UPI001CB7BAA3|nr:uncharacterized protein LOC122558552 isoform X2 [Chiloscyllium plagiosum]
MVLLTDVGVRFGFFLILSLASADRDARGEARAAKRCYCDLQMSDGPFPHQQLDELYLISQNCSFELNKQQFNEPLEILAYVDQKLRNLVQRINEFEEEYDGELYSIISYRIIEIEIAELNELLNQLQEKCSRNNDERTDLDTQAQNITNKVDELEKYDRLKVTQEHKRNIILKRSLTSCQNALLVTPTPYVSPQPGAARPAEFLQQSLLLFVPWYLMVLPSLNSPTTFILGITTEQKLNWTSHINTEISNFCFCL